MADSLSKATYSAWSTILPGSQMSKPSIDGTPPDFRNNASVEKSRRLTRDLGNLQQEIRIDFDQRISGLSTLMNKFKALMVTDLRSLNAANDAHKDTVINTSTVPVLTKKIDDATLADSKIIASELTEAVDQPTTNPVKPTAGHLAVMRETARFEAGLYQLNCQLYRFRLELDQELEYREEPLHIHFNRQSDLSTVLEQITQKKKQEQDNKH